MKQTVKYIHIMVAVLVAAFAAGCTKDFDKNQHRSDQDKFRQHKGEQHV